MRLAGEGVQGAQDLPAASTELPGPVPTSGTHNASQSSTLGAPEQDPRILVLFSLAKELGFALEAESTWERVLARDITLKLSRRLGDFVMQSVAFSVRAFPQKLAERLFPSCFLTTPLEDLQVQEAVRTWRFESEVEVCQVFGDILTLHSKTNEFAGITRALQTKSERVVRLVASIMGGMEISHGRQDGVPMLWVNYLYTLCTDTGELFKPKTPDRREIALEPWHESAIRQQILADMVLMGERGFPLSAAWWRQMGMEERALEVEAELEAPRRRSASWAERRGRVARVQEPRYEIDCILREVRSTGKAVM